ncbi:hypothetical protein FRB90_008872, partial [Tulasnella sp. 427]
YWCIIDISNSPEEVVKLMDRAQASSLCVYCGPSARWDRGSQLSDRITSALITRREQIRTLRFNHHSLYGLGLSLIHSGLPHLRTLQLVRGSVDLRSVEPDYNAPQLRHLFVSTYYLDLSASAKIEWIQALETLVIDGLGEFRPSFNRVIESCANGLRKLFLQFEQLRSTFYLSDDMMPVFLPMMEEIRVGMPRNRHRTTTGKHLATQVLRTMLFPPLAGGTIAVVLDPRDLTVVDELSNFLFPDGAEALPPEPAIMELRLTEWPVTWVQYARGNRTLRLGIRCADYYGVFGAISNCIQALHRRLGNPVISVSISWSKYTSHAVELLRLLASSSSNVQKLSILVDFSLGLRHVVMSAIRTRSDMELEGNPDDWAFPGLRHLSLSLGDPDGALNVEWVVLAIVARQKELLASGKSGLEEIVLKDCPITDMTVLEMAEKLRVEGIQVTEENDGGPFEFCLDNDALGNAAY